MFEEGIELKQKYGQENVFDLSLGNPVMEPPAEVHRELQKLAENPVPGMHRDMENAGYIEPRQAVADYLSKESGLKFTIDDIVMTCGAAGALNDVLKTVLDYEDEVILFAPFFPEYVSYTENHYGINRIVPSDEKFVPRLEALETAINPRTRAVLLNSPNNHSGAVYDGEFFRQLGDLLRKKEAEFGIQILLINDEPYRKIVYDGQVCPQIWEYYQDSVVATSHSKDLALPGERIGYLAIHPECAYKAELMNGFIYCNRILGYINAPAIMQHAVRQLLDVSVPVSEYQRKRDFLYDNLTGMGYSIVKPQGTFYMYPATPVDDDVAFVKELQEERVLTVPGRGFGTPGYIRISFCVEDKTLELSLVGFRKIARKYRLC
jgi:aspartate aminotransferase